MEKYFLKIKINKLIFPQKKPLGNTKGLDFYYFLTNSLDLFSPSLPA